MALAKNRERDAEIIRLVEEEGLNSVEAADRMKVTKNVVTGVLYRHRKALPQKSMLPAEGKVEDTQEGNTRILAPKGIVIRTLDELLEFCEVDLAEWSVAKSVVNFWGNRDNPNTQVKAWLARVNPLEIKPVLKPVQVKIGRTKKLGATTKNVGRALVINDPHFGFHKSLRTGQLDPFHDRGALDVALQIAQYVRPDIVVCGGDVLDLADWSDKFARSPNMYWTTQPAALEAAWWLGQFRKVSEKLSVIEGNHDERMNRLIIQQAKEAFGLRSVDGMNLPPLLSVPRLLGLHTMDIEYVGDYPNGKVWVGDQVKVVHGDKTAAKSGATVAKMLDQAQVSTVMGHIHRIELAYKTVYAQKPKVIGALSTGCLCRVDGVVPGRKEDQNWQQGVGVIDYWDGGHNLIPVPISDGRAYFEGRSFEARDRMDELKAATDWAF